jgi:NAD(P)H-hydrate epimerase
VVYRCISRYVGINAGCFPGFPSIDYPVNSTTSLYTAAQLRELDRIAIETAGIPGYTLMTRAGAAAWQVLVSSWPAARTLAVVCGRAATG